MRPLSRWRGVELRLQGIVDCVLYFLSLGISFLLDLFMYYEWYLMYSFLTFSRITPGTPDTQSRRENTPSLTRLNFALGEIC
jgi:hypothetical protein